LASSEDTSTTDEGFFNNYTRKLLSYTLAGIFGVIFLIGMFQMYRIFFSKEAKMRKAFEQELKVKRLQELDKRQRRAKE
jgi:hypothetical protein